MIMTMNILDSLFFVCDLFLFFVFVFFVFWYHSVSEWGCHMIVSWSGVGFCLFNAAMFGGLGRLEMADSWLKLFSVHISFDFIWLRLFIFH